MNDKGKARHQPKALLSVRYTQKPGCIVEARISMTPAALGAARAKACKELSKSVSIPGFRQGHIPEEILASGFSAQLRRAEKEQLVQMAYQETAKVTGRRFFSSTSLQKLTWAKPPGETGAELELVYEAAPELPSVDLQALTIEPVAPMLPTEQDLERELFKARYIACADEPVTDRPVTEGDIAQCAVLKADGTEAATTDICVHPFLIPEWLVKALIGVSVGEAKDIVPPEAVQGKESCMLAGRVVVKKIFLPAASVDDPQIAGLFSLPTVENLKKFFRAKLEFEAKLAAHERMRKQVRNELIRLYAFDLPQSLVDGETDARFIRYWQQLGLSTSAPNTETVRKLFLDEVKRYYTCFFLFRDLFRDTPFSYSERDIFNEYQAQLSAPPYQKVIYLGLTQEQLSSRVFSSLVMKRCEDRCIKERLGLDAPTFKDFPVPKSAPPEPAVEGTLLEDKGTTRPAEEPVQDSQEL